MKLGNLTIDENQMTATLLATAYVAPQVDRFCQMEDGHLAMRQPTAEERLAEAVQRTEEFMAILLKRASAAESAARAVKEESGPHEP